MINMDPVQPRNLCSQGIMLTFFSSLVFTHQLDARSVKDFGFSQYMSSYTPINRGATLWSANFYQQISASQTIPAFTMAGSVYTRMRVSTNGSLTLGGSAPSVSEHYPLSSTRFTSVRSRRSERTCHLRQVAHAPSVGSWSVTRSWSNGGACDERTSLADTSASKPG
jgi:hypothetical protein